VIRIFLLLHSRVGLFSSYWFVLILFLRPSLFEEQGQGFGTTG
jgi:hypothetical protein